jgi:hypothetical protein
MPYYQLFMPEGVLTPSFRSKIQVLVFGIRPKAFIG